jgi:hypothetical protein
LSVIGAGSRPHVWPIPVDVFDAFLTGVLLVDDRPASRDLGGRGPERMLTMVINEDNEGAALIVEGVAHVRAPVLSFSLRNRG